MNPPESQPSKLSLTAWLVLTIASIGFLFDTYELLMTPLVAVPAIAALLQLPPNNPVVIRWFRNMLWMTALCGGIFGLLGGWLIDRFGRKTIMAASIFLYALSPFAAAFSTSLPMFFFFRCTTFIGVCVEFVAAITWLAELFPDKRQKEIALGSTQAFASLAGLFVTGMYGCIAAHTRQLPALPVAEIFNNHAPWRYLLISGLLPAIPIALLLPFVPESKVWQERRAAGALKRPSFAQLFSPELRRTTLVTALLSACAYAAAFGALQLTPRSIVPGLADLADQRKALKARGENMQLWQEVGGLGGRIVLAVLLLAAISRGTLLRLFLVPGLIIFPLTYLYLFREQPGLFQFGIAAAGFLTVAQFSYFGEYLPKVFPLHLRGTGGGFAITVGCRMLGTAAAFITTNLIAPHLTGTTFEQVATAAAIVGTSVFVLGVILSFFLPEPKP